jgi:hypothetical protein
MVPARILSSDLGGAVSDGVSAVGIGVISLLVYKLKYAVNNDIYMARGKGPYCHGYVTLLFD